MAFDIIEHYLSLLLIQARDAGSKTCKPWVCMARSLRVPDVSVVFCCDVAALFGVFALSLARASTAHTLLLNVTSAAVLGAAQLGTKSRHSCSYGLARAQLVSCRCAEARALLRSASCCAAWAWSAAHSRSCGSSTCLAAASLRPRVRGSRAVARSAASLPLLHQLRSRMAASSC